MILKIRNVIFFNNPKYFSIFFPNILLFEIFVCENFNISTNNLNRCQSYQGNIEITLVAFIVDLIFDF